MCYKAILLVIGLLIPSAGWSAPIINSRNLKNVKIERGCTPSIDCTIGKFSPALKIEFDVVEAGGSKHFVYFQTDRPFCPSEADNCADVLKNTEERIWKDIWQKARPILTAFTNIENGRLEFEEICKPPRKICYEPLATMLLEPGSVFQVKEFFLDHNQVACPH